MASNIEGTDVEVDPHEPLRTILQIILGIVTVAFLGVSVALIVVPFQYRSAVPWITTTYTITSKEEQDLVELKDSSLADKLVWGCMGLGMFVALASLFGAVAAFCHFKNGMYAFAVAMAIVLLLMIFALILLLVLKDKLELKLQEFGDISIRKGFTGTSDGVGDRAPGAIITYVWQWLQVKLKCCGWMDGEDYEHAVVWERDTKTWDLTEVPASRANLLLTLPNRVKYVPDTDDEKSNSTGLVTKVTLRQVLPPSCCSLSGDSEQSQYHLSAYLPTDFNDLELENPDCPYTNEASYKHQGCWNAFKTEFSKNFYGIVATLGGVIVLLLLGAVLSIKLANIPSKSELAKENSDKAADRPQELAGSSMIGEMLITPPDNEPSRRRSIKRRRSTKSRRRR